MFKAKPFVKWAGWKRQIIDKLKKYIPDEFDDFYEPFVGGGALLFESSPKKAVINEITNQNPLLKINKPNHKKINGNALSNEDELKIEKIFHENTSHHY